MYRIEISSFEKYIDTFRYQQKIKRYDIISIYRPTLTTTTYAIKTGNITQVTLLTNVIRYLSNIVTVTNLILLLQVTKLLILLVIH